MVDGGNAVDAAIATVFCIGAVNPQSAGIGGGFFMTLYDPVKRVARSLNAREVAPIAATEYMFKGDSKISQRGSSPSSTFSKEDSNAILTWLNSLFYSVFFLGGGE